MKNNVWALLACTALGFIIGRELPRRGSSPGDGPDAAPPPTAKTTAAVAPEAPRPTPPAPPAPAAPRPSPNQKVELAKWTPVKGPNTAKVTIVEFSDFQWPFCSRVGPTLKDIEKKYGKDVRIAFMHQPLPFHDKAREAAEATMAAHAQGKFWPMHDKLFENNKALDRPSLDRYAQEIGLNMARFKADMDGHKFKDQIDADSKLGTSVGAAGTPTFFINGRQLVGAQPLEQFSAIIDEELKKADALLKRGIKPEQLYAEILKNLPASPTPSPQAAAPAAGEKVDIQAAADAPAKGPARAAVTMIAVSEFQWPFCSRVGPTLKQLEQDYAGKLRIVFMHQPLPFHNNAQLAAEASMAAHAQGKFWPMHDKMFENQKALERPDLERYAQEIGLNMAKFKAALDSGAFKARVAQDSAAATKAGASGTPTFFINGRRLVGAQPVDQFKKIIDEELAKKK